MGLEQGPAGPRGPRGRRGRPSLLHFGSGILPYIVSALIGLYAASLASGFGHDFCRLNAGRVIDKQSELRRTTDYLAGPPRNAADRNLQRLVRQISLPQLRKELDKERAQLPEKCYDEYQAASK